MNRMTTINIHPDTRDRLRAAKTGNETYTDVINRLLNEHEEKDPDD